MGEEHSCAFIFPFGAMVLFNATEWRGALQQQLKPFLRDTAERVSDKFELEFAPDQKEHVEFKKVVLCSMRPEKMKLVALVLAQSTSLEHYEMLADELMQKTAEITRDMASKGRTPKPTREMIRYIGVGFATRRDLVNHLSLLDPPETTWDDPDLHSLYGSLRSNFDLASRFRSLEYKLDLVRELAQMVVDLADSRRATILELTIILLIALEIVLYLANIMGH